VLDRPLGQGGFGITYLASDTNLDRRVAIKEYLPSEIARRRSDAAAHPRTESQSERYAWGLDRFLAEARTLARFDHPNIVRVHSVFEANNTAYMVMRFEEGESLAVLLARVGVQTERQLLQWLLPILDGLELVHKAGYIHRDIKPDNIYVRADGSPVLLDFGSARQAFGSSKTMTILVAPGYAPLEQYYGDAATQGAWTDIYGLAATCYRAISGRVPLDAIARAKGVLGSAREVLTPALELGRGRYSSALLAAIDQALRMSEGDRPQTVADWRRALVAPAAAAAVQEPVVPAAPGAAAQIGALPTAATPVATAPQTTPAAPVMAAGATHAAPASPWRARWLWAGPLGAGALAGIAVWILRSPVPDRVQPPEVSAAPAIASAPAAASAPVVATATAPPRPPPPPTAAQIAETPKLVITPASTKAPPGPRPRPPEGLLVAATRPKPGNVPAPATAEAKPAALATVAAQRPPETGPATAASAPAPTLALALPASAPAVAPKPPPEAPTRTASLAQIEAAEAALRRGDSATAAQIVKPWAMAGLPHAQLVLGQALAMKSGPQQSPFEAYGWLRLAARAGEPEAHALSDKVAAQLQPAEVRQAEAMVQSWRPRPPVAASAPP
jgi:hypothetical protein